MMRALVAVALVTRLAGCSPCEPQGPAPASAGEHDGSDFGNARVSAGKLEGLGYLEAVLGEPNRGERIPLVIAIHGLGDKPRPPYSPYEGLPTPFRVIAPRAPQRHGTGFGWFAVRVREGKPERLAEAIDTRAQQVAAFIETLASNSPSNQTPGATRSMPSHPHAAPSHDRASRSRDVNWGASRQRERCDARR